MADDTEEYEAVPASIEFNQADLAVIDRQIATAKQYPRNTTRCVDSAIAIVTLDKETAATCNYGVPRDGKTIAGPSVHLARILAQCFGNMRTGSRIIAIDETHVTAEALCFDLENNYAMSASVKRSIRYKSGKKFNNDLITLTGNAAAAIALRNAIFAVIPRGYSNKVYKAALHVITGDVSDKVKLKAEALKVVKGMQDAYNVSEAEVLGAINRPTINTISAEDLVTLYGIGQAITDNELSVDNAFRAKQQAAPARSESEERIERAKNLLGDQKNLEDLNNQYNSLPEDVKTAVKADYEASRDRLVALADSEGQ